MEWGMGLISEIPWQSVGHLATLTGETFYATESHALLLLLVPAVQADRTVPHLCRLSEPYALSKTDLWLHYLVHVSLELAILLCMVVCIAIVPTDMRDELNDTPHVVFGYGFPLAIGWLSFHNLMQLLWPRWCGTDMVCIDCEGENHERYAEEHGECNSCARTLNSWVAGSTWFIKMVLLTVNGCLNTVTLQFLNDRSVLDLVLTDKNPDSDEHKAVFRDCSWDDPMNPQYRCVSYASIMKKHLSSACSGVNAYDRVWCIGYDLIGASSTCTEAQSKMQWMATTTVVCFTVAFVCNLLIFPWNSDFWGHHTMMNPDNEEFFTESWPGWNCNQPPRVDVGVLRYFIMQWNDDNREMTALETQVQQQRPDSGDVRPEATQSPPYTPGVGLEVNGVREVPELWDDTATESDRDPSVYTLEMVTVTESDMTQAE